MNSRKKVEQISIDECIFGPSRKCPSNIWDAVLSYPSGSFDNASSPRGSPKSFPTKMNEMDATSNASDNGNNNNNKKTTPIDLSGIDDLDQGRWADPIATANSLDHIIRLSDLRRLASQGIVDQGSHRAVSWRILLGYLPPELSEWQPTLLQQRTLYRNLVAELFVEPEHDGNELRGHHGKRQKAQRQKQYMERMNAAAAAAAKKDETDDEREKVEENVQTSSAETQKEPTKDESKKITNGSQPTTEQTEKTEEPSEKDGEKAAGEQQLAQQDEGGQAEKDDSNLLDDSFPRPPDLSRAVTDSEVGGQQNGDSKTSGRRSTFHANDHQRPLISRSNPDSTLIGQDESKPESAEANRSTEDFDFKEDESTKQRLTRTASDWLKNNGVKQEEYNSGDELDVDEVPAKIKEEWRKSGRDAQTLDSISRGEANMNTLLVNENPRLTAPRNTGGRVAVHDDPLSTDTDSKWFQFFENASLLDEIRKDVVRTHPDLYFFLEPEDSLGQRRYAALERILFVWAKLNKGVRYVQGMNEIVGTLYYVLANDFNDAWACEAEADTYFLFNILMTEMRDVFVPDLDEADTGIQGRISNMTSLLSLHDPEVRCHLVDLGIDASFYAIRWLTTLLSREFLLPDTIRLWDSMFASTHKDNFLRYVCVTMVMLIRDDLLKGDFSTCLRLLQSYPSTNVDNLLESSRALWIYESQVTLACHKGGISLHQALNTITPPPSIVMAYGLPGGMAKPADFVESLEPVQSPGRTGWLSRLGRNKAR